MNTTYKCHNCGLVNNSIDGTECRRCGTTYDPNAPGFKTQYQGQQQQPQPQPQMQPMPMQHPQQMIMANGQLPYTLDPSQARFGGGKTCPRCGITNSFSQYQGAVWIVICVLFLTCLGLVLVPFLPKQHTCRACGYTW
ncbi:MAG: hypothetical protein FD167_4407 [bacterium]|nr:MAG: hypothetical protein FD167_4407 [bacterium]